MFADELEDETCFPRGRSYIVLRLFIVIYEPTLAPLSLPESLTRILDTQIQALDILRQRASAEDRQHGLFGELLHQRGKLENMRRVPADLDLQLALDAIEPDASPPCQSVFRKTGLAKREQAKCSLRAVNGSKL